MSTTFDVTTLFYDASCPVCSLEMDHLRERNHAGRLAFVDIAAPGFDPSPYGATLAEMNDEIHALLPDGRVIRGVPVLRLAYDAVGLGWMMGFTGWAPWRGAFDHAYRVFARYRQPISRAAAPLIHRIRAARARRMARRMQQCGSGACSVHRASGD